MKFFDFLDRNMFAIAATTVTLTLIVGGGYLGKRNDEQRQARALACINAGQMYISGNCISPNIPVTIPVQ